MIWLLKVIGSCKKTAHIVRMYISRIATQFQLLQHVEHSLNKFVLHIERDPARVHRPVGHVQRE